MTKISLGCIEYIRCRLYLPMFAACHECTEWPDSASLLAVCMQCTLHAVCVESFGTAFPKYVWLLEWPGSASLSAVLHAVYAACCVRGVIWCSLYQMPLASCWFLKWIVLDRYCVLVSIHSLLYSIGEYDISVCVSRPTAAASKAFDLSVTLRHGRSWSVSWSVSVSVDSKKSVYRYRSKMGYSV